MTLKDTMHGPDWVIWVVFAFFLIVSVVLLSGHGANLIAGYNTASEEEKNRYDTKKLCRTIGGGMALIAVLILVMALGEAVLPASFAYVSLGVILADCVTLVILANTICKKKD